ncbi:hypothetical protein WN944_022088 [Citrus x changshan-huyou]|uniref:Uncharacterized protein n=1 Tax=Citrus x changshan-huyou TaxID=2935761 RepID=A0AAP0N2F4_9ROSI
MGSRMIGATTVTQNRQRISTLLWLDPWHILPGANPRKLKQQNSTSTLIQHSIPFLSILSITFHPPWFIKLANRMPSNAAVFCRWRKDADRIMWEYCTH